MTHVWIDTADGDLLRADQIRQITVVDGLRVVTISGSQFLIAEVEGRAAASVAAHDLASAIAEADGWSQAAEIDVLRDDEGWRVRLSPLRSADRPEHDDDTVGVPG